MGKRITSGALSLLLFGVGAFGQEIEIVGESMSSDGIASAYVSHRFQVNNCTGKELADINWSFTLPLKGGGEETVATDSDVDSIDIPAIADEDKYEISTGGDIYGKIVCKAMAAGKEVEDVCHVTLQLKPYIKNVTITRKEQRKPYASYDLYYTVEYYGADEILVELDEEYGSSLRQQYVKEPILAHVVTPYISAAAYAWIDITAENKYGKDTYTLELDPVDEFLSDSGMGDTTETAGNHINDGITRIEVYTIAGRRIAATGEAGDLQKLNNGIFILNVYRNDGIPMQVKYVKR